MFVILIVLVSIVSFYGIVLLLDQNALLREDLFNDYRLWLVVVVYLVVIIGLLVCLFAV